MKNKFVIIFVFFSQAIFSQQTFQKAYATDSLDGGLYLDAASNGQFYIGGFTNFSDPLYWDAFITKINSEGDTLWTNIIGKVSHVEWLVDMKATNDGGVITAFNTDTFPYDVVLVKLDSNGNTSWTKTIGPNVNAYSLIQTQDSGFALMYFSSSYFGIMKTDQFGNVQWLSSHFNNLTTTIAWRIKLVQTSDNGFAFAVTTDTFSIALVKTNNLGIVQWSKIYSSPWQDHCFNLEQTSDTGFVILGEMQSAPYSKELVIKTNSFGDTLWVKSYSSTLAGNEYSPTGIFQASDQGYYFAGITLGGFSVNKISLARTDSNGNLLWAKKYGGFLDDWPNDILRTNDGGVLITGTTNSLCNNHNSNVYLIKTDSLGFSGCNEVIYPLAVQHPYINVLNLTVSPAAPVSLSNQTSYTFNHEKGFSVSTACSYLSIEEPKKISGCNIFPNPSNGIFHCTQTFSSGILEVTDISGRIIYSRELKNEEPIIDLTGSPDGFYFLSIIYDQKKYDQRLIICR